ncbi:hypothetical protein TNCV_2821851 [Trichonephila clavipes]|uniref:Uncharacterized protein n=1 Tax=Trichonephila clavipes TaxID=2585209 RepID=A0A8X6WHM8_TRICX|nr:hypothetical protein TNCV_2821851 [Trichonephila clavipes]
MIIAVRGARLIKFYVSWINILVFDYKLAVKLHPIADKDNLHAEIVEVEIDVVSPSIVPSGNFAELNRTVTCMVLKANDRRTSCPCHEEFRGPDLQQQHEDLSVIKTTRPNTATWSFAKSSFESRARSYQGYVFGASQVSYHPPAPILCRDCGDMRYATDKGTEAARATGLSKSEDFISEVVDDAPSVKNLTEEEHQERILRKQRAIK